MSVRQLCRETERQPSKALFYFPEENKTGIAPVRIVIEKNGVLMEGSLDTVNWAGEKVRAEILALSGKFVDYTFVKLFHWRCRDCFLTILELRRLERSRMARRKPTSRREQRHMYLGATQQERTKEEKPTSSFIRRDRRYLRAPQEESCTTKGVNWFHIYPQVVLIIELLVFTDSSVYPQ